MYLFYQKLLALAIHFVKINYRANVRNKLINSCSQFFMFAAKTP